MPRKTRKLPPEARQDSMLAMPITSVEGWFVTHLYYTVDRGAWEVAEDSSREACTTEVSRLIEEFCSVDNAQLFCYTIWGSKADFGLLAIHPDLEALIDLESDLFRAFPAASLCPTFSYTSMSEVSEYLSQETDYDRTLREKDGLSPESEEYKSKMEAFRSRMRVYIEDRLYPKIPPHRVMCFYPMNKSRGEKDNWYLLDFDTRKTYMASHAITGRKYAEHVRQLVTGSVGLDQWEWGVTLFADDPFYFKQIVYEMRYDEASARFGEFGDFIIGVQIEPNQLVNRLRLPL